MSKIDKLSKLLSSKSKNWNKIISLHILNVSNNYVWCGNGYLCPPDKSFNYGLFTDNEDFFHFIQNKNESWHLNDEGMSYLDGIYFWDEAQLTKKFFNSDGFIEPQLVCIQSYLEKIHSDLKIPFLISGEKDDNFVIIRGYITGEQIEFQNEI